MIVIVRVIVVFISMTNRTIIRVVVIDVAGLVDVEAGVDLDLEVLAVGVVQVAARLVEFDRLTTSTRRQLRRRCITVLGLKRVGPFYWIRLFGIHILNSLCTSLVSCHSC